MNTETKKLYVDRVEDGVIIAYSIEKTEYIFSNEDSNIHENDILIANINENNEVVSVIVLQEETTKRINTLKNRVKKLFNKRG